MSYTGAACLGVVAAVVVDLLVLRTQLLRRRPFWVAYTIVLVGQLVTNGLLAGRQVVRYDPGAILGDGRPRAIGDGRLVWAPVEDLLFGFSLVLATLSLWVFWGRQGVQREPAAGPPRWRRHPPPGRSREDAHA